jgi:hypothetical protein
MSYPLIIVPDSLLPKSSSQKKVTQYWRSVAFPPHPSVLLGFELRSIHLLCRCSTTWVMPPVLFSSGYFGYWVSFFAQAGLDYGLPILPILPQLGWQVCGTTPNFFPLKWGSLKLFCSCWSGPWPSYLCFCVAGMTGTHHFAQLLAEMGSRELFARAGLKSWSPPSHPSNKNDYKSESLMPG